MTPCRRRIIFHRAAVIATYLHRSRDKSISDWRTQQWSFWFWRSAISPLRTCTLTFNNYICFADVYCIHCWHHFNFFGGYFPPVALSMLWSWWCVIWRKKKLTAHFWVSWWSRKMVLFYKKVRRRKLGFIWRVVLILIKRACCCTAAGPGRKQKQESRLETKTNLCVCT